MTNSAEYQSWTFNLRSRPSSGSAGDGDRVFAGGGRNAISASTNLHVLHAFSGGAGGDERRPE